MKRSLPTWLKTMSRSLELRAAFRTSSRGFSMLVAALLVAPGLLAAEPDRALAVDSVCAWGRLADGTGHLVRCLTESESAHLRETAPAPASDSTKPSSVPLAAVVPNDFRPEPTPVPAPDPVEPVPEPSDVTKVLAEVGKITADVGALPEGTKNLNKARARYAECVEKNGGLSAERGSVELRFLVRGKGRVEGIGVQKKRGVSDAAAKCIADVVGRRYVGYPEAPIVAATATVSIIKKKR